MSLERRQELEEQIVNEQPELGAFVRNLPSEHDMLSGSWDLLAYSFQRGFETFWDAARAYHNDLLLRPLLVLWRQSVELSLKAAITAIAGGIDGRPGHDLEALFARLLQARTALGYLDDDELTRRVQEMVALVQSLDPYADRFRYPSSRGGRTFEGVVADFDELFQAHWIIVTYCEGAAIEVEETTDLN
jgi:HEPN domain-containing protein